MELDECKKIEDRYRQWIKDGKSYAIRDHDGLTMDERLANMDISREMDLINNYCEEME